VAVPAFTGFVDKIQYMTAFVLVFSIVFISGGVFPFTSGKTEVVVVDHMMRKRQRVEIVCCHSFGK
jgi:hypothetical protein